MLETANALFIQNLHTKTSDVRHYYTCMLHNERESSSNSDISGAMWKRMALAAGGLATESNNKLKVQKEGCAKLVKFHCVVVLYQVNHSKRNCFCSVLFLQNYLNCHKVPTKLEVLYISNIFRFGEYLNINCSVAICLLIKSSALINVIT